MNSPRSFKWGAGVEADLIRTMDSKELSKSINDFLKGKNLEEGIWVFGYGSLMWNPDLKLAEKRNGYLKGYHRSLCLKSIVYRGSPEYHGLVFGLDYGNSCEGIVYRIEEKNIKSEIMKLWEREMFAGTYIPTWVNVKTKQGTISAVTFVINQDHKHYISNLEIEEIAERVIKAEGTCGSCHDYVRNTVTYLQNLGLRDHSLEQLIKFIENYKN
tara:strand:- start:430 stop:1071 length:642 start_codon:yes stop_codon:yes gene_type:complete